MFDARWLYPLVMKTRSLILASAITAVAILVAGSVWLLMRLG